MLTSGVLYFFYGVAYIFTLPLRIVADVTLAAAGSTAIAQFIPYIAIMNFFIALATISQILGVIILIETGVISFKGLMWLLRRLPTQS